MKFHCGFSLLLSESFDANLRFALFKLSGGGQRSRQRTKYFAPIARAKQVFACALGMRHQAQDIAFTIANPSDVVARAVRVCFIGNLSLRVAVPNAYAVVTLKLANTFIFTP